KELDRTSRQLMQNISDLGERNLINWSQEINYPDLEQLAKNSTSDSPNRQTLLRNYFNWIWLCDKLSDHDSLILRKLIDSESIFWHEKCLIISALTLGLLKGFDQRRFEILLEIHENGIIQLSQRALSGLILALYRYDTRLQSYPSITNRLRIKMGDDKLEKEVIEIIIQFLRAKDTEKITRKFREEIIPDIVKSAHGMEERLGLTQFDPKNISQDKNPDWRTMLNDSPDLIRKLEEVSRMQLEGIDVLMGAFAHLKRFDFFNETSNWLLPFYREHPLLSETLEGEEQHFKEALAEGLEHSTYMCNSDKYSFCLSIENMPKPQKEMIIRMFSAEVEGMTSMMKEEQLLNSRFIWSSITTRYIQDLYRFFKLHPFKHEFDDPFLTPLDFHNKQSFNDFFSNSEAWRILADFYLDNDHFSDAMILYQRIIDERQPSQELFEKAGYCSEKLGKTETALQYYRKAELYDRNRLWNLRKIAQCYMKLGQYQNSLDYYQEAAIIAPGNMPVQMEIGYCLLKMANYSDALNHFLRLEIEFPGDRTLNRPLAWCMFATGRLKEALQRYEILTDDEPNRFDYMNMGHVYWCLGRRKDAVECYRKSINKSSGKRIQFIVDFEEDKSLLIKHGIDPAEIHLIVDAIDNLSTL
ncbi:MAG TPA: tetratricopeptide repeat protein, partial [Bacteroidales bacterium]|nr:tetratricopeptide repeat protein [Bacteroidales bacterium]